MSSNNLREKTLVKIVPDLNGFDVLLKLPEMVERQGLYIGQEVFYKSKYYTERVKISGYIFEMKDGQLKLNYCVQTVHSIKMAQEGVYDEPDTLIVTFERLVCSSVHQPMCFVHH